MADAGDLKSPTARCAGSIPAPGTKNAFGEVADHRHRVRFRMLPYLESIRQRSGQEGEEIPPRGPF